jgi:uncharacterized membrane protein
MPQVFTLGLRGNNVRVAAQPGTQRASLTAPGIVLGLGLGGFVDGIVLHQIVQWHNMLSSTERWPTTTLKGMEANMRADGLFHAATWVLVVLGLWMLWKAMRTGAYGSGRVLVGWMLAGWGIFNLCEGIINHEILGLHHVKEGGNELPWDLAFLAFGLVLVVGGWILQGHSQRLRRRRRSRAASAFRPR